MGRPVDVGRRQERQNQFLAAFAQTGILARAAEQSGIVATQHHVWLKQDPEYASRFAELKEQTRDAAAEHRKPHSRGYRVGGQRGQVRQANQEAFLKVLESTGILVDAARQVGIAKATYNAWMRDDPDFAQRAEQTLQDSAHLRQEGLFQRRSEAGQAAWADSERREEWGRRQREEFWTPERRAEQAQRQVELAKDPEIRAARAAASQARWSDPEAREREAQRMRERWTDPEFRTKLLETNKRPEVRAARSRAARARWATFTAAERKERMRKMRSTFKGGYRLTKIEADVMVALNERELPYFVHKPVDGYVADLLVPSLNLVIECDGAYHHDQRPDSDAARDVAMQELGYEVLRLSQDEITNKTWDRLDETIGRLST